MSTEQAVAVWAVYHVDDEHGGVLVGEQGDVLDAEGSINGEHAQHTQGEPDDDGGQEVHDGGEGLAPQQEAQRWDKDEEKDEHGDACHDGAHDDSAGAGGHTQARGC